MERTRPHLIKGARVDEKTNEVQTSLRVDQNQDIDKDKDKNKNKDKDKDKDKGKDKDKDKDKDKNKDKDKDGQGHKDTNKEHVAPFVRSNNLYVLFTHRRTCLLNVWVDYLGVSV